MSDELAEEPGGVGPNPRTSAWLETATDALCLDVRPSFSRSTTWSNVDTAEPTIRTISVFFAANTIFHDTDP